MSYVMAPFEALQQRTYGMQFQQLASAYYQQQQQQHMAHMWQTQSMVAEAMMRHGWSLPVRAETVPFGHERRARGEHHDSGSQRGVASHVGMAPQASVASGFTCANAAPKIAQSQAAMPTALVAETVDRDAKRPCTERTIAHVASTPRAPMAHAMSAPAAGAAQPFPLGSRRLAQPPQVARTVRTEPQQAFAFGHQQGSHAPALAPQQASRVAFRFANVERGAPVVAAAAGKAPPQVAPAVASETAPPLRATAVWTADTAGGVIKASVVQPSPAPSPAEQRKSPDVEEALTLLMLQAGGSDTVERPPTPSAFRPPVQHQPRPVRALTVAKPAVAVSA